MYFSCVSTGNWCEELVGGDISEIVELSELKEVCWRWFTSLTASPGLTYHFLRVASLISKKVKEDGGGVGTFAEIGEFHLLDGTEICHSNSGEIAENASIAEICC